MQRLPRCSRHSLYKCRDLPHCSRRSLYKCRDPPRCSRRSLYKCRDLPHCSRRSLYKCRDPPRCSRRSLYKCRDLPHCSQRSLYKRSACSTIRGAACFYAVPAPLFAAQPIKVFCRGFFSKKPESFLAYLFFKKGKFQKSGRRASRVRIREAGSVNTTPSMPQARAVAIFSSLSSIKKHSAGSSS